MYSWPCYHDVCHVLKANSLMNLSLSHMPLECSLKCVYYIMQLGHSAKLVSDVQRYTYAGILCNTPQILLAATKNCEIPINFVQAGGQLPLIVVNLN